MEPLIALRGPAIPQGVEEGAVSSVRCVFNAAQCQPITNSSKQPYKTLAPFIPPAAPEMLVYHMTLLIMV